MRMGAYDFLEKPYSGERLSEVLKRALFTRRLVLENRRLRAGLDGAGPTTAVGRLGAFATLVVFTP